MAEAVDFKYRAFLSYAHADAHRAAWLHLQLERFRLASDLIGRTTALGPVPTSLRPIFRDRDDFTGGQALGEATIAALDQAATLIVLCSEIAATRHAVNEEVRLFRWRHPDRPVIPVIISGTAPDNFPPALRFAVAADGAVTDRAVTILGPDLRDEGDGRSRGLAKLVAGLIGVDTDEIVRRAERDQRRRQRNWIGGLSGLALVLAGLGVWAEINRREAVEQRGLAVTERSSSNQLRSVTSARLSEEQLAGGNTTEALRSALEGVAASDKPTAELVTAISRGILHQNRGSVLRSPGDTAIGAFFSAGELVTTVGAEGHIAVWDASRPTPMRSFRSASVLRRAVMAPDGRHLVTSDQHGAVQIRSVTDLSVATRVSERPGHVAGLGFMAGGRQLAIVQSDGALSIIDPARVAAPAASDQPKSNGGIPVAEEAGGQAGPTGSLSIGQPGGSRITHAAFGQDRTIVIATSDAGVWTVNLSSPGTPTPVGQHDSPITSLSRSPDGRYALTTSLNGIAWLWDLTAKTPHRRVPVFDVVSLTASAFSTDGKLAAIGADTGSITIWDVGSMSRLATLDDHRGLIFQLSFDRSGRRLVSTSADGTTRVWIIRTPDQAEVTNLDQITSYQGRNSLFAASPDGSRFLARGTNNMEAQVVSVARDRPGIVLPHTVPVPVGLLLDDASKAVTATMGGEIILWDIGSRVDRRVLAQGLGRVASLARSPDGSLIAGISEARRLVLCSIVEQTACDDLTPRHPGWGTDVAFSPDGKQLASTSYNAGGQDGGVGYIWDVATRTRVSVLEGHEERVSSIEFSPDGKSAVTASWDKTARLWNVADGSTRAVLRGHAGRVTAARFSPNGAWLATASYDRTASLWRAKPAGDGAEPGAPELHAKLVGHNRDVIDVAFSPDSRLLATGSFDGTVRLWETGQGTLRAVLRGDGSPIVKVTFSRDGSTLLAGATTGSVLRWTVSPIASAATEALVGIGRSLLPLPLVFDATATGLTNQIIRAPPETAECPLAVARSLGVPPHHVSGALRARRRDELPEVCIEQKARTASQAAFLEGSLHAFRGHTINARAKWREALGLGSVDALVALGDLARLDHGEQASADEAMRHYEQAATRGVSLAHARLGWLAAEREQAASAREHFARAADAAEPDGYAGLGWLEEQAAESSSGQLKTAFKSYAVAELLYGIRGERDKAAIIAEQRVRVAARLAHMELPDLLAEAVANASAARSRRSATPQDGPAQQGQPR